MVFDPSEPEIDMSKFPAEDWGYSIYLSPGEEVKETLPPNMPKPLGKEFILRMFVNDRFPSQVTQTLGGSTTEFRS